MDFYPVKTVEKPDSNNPDSPHKTEGGPPIRVGPDGKVHNLISQIERLKHLCTEGLSNTDDTKTPGNSGLEQPPGQTFTQHRELGELILRSLDGDITPESFAQLEKWIKEHPEALRYYIDYVHLCADLKTSNKKDSLLKYFQLVP